MSRHAYALVALAVAINIESKFIHCLIIERQPILTLIEAILHCVWRYVITVLTAAGAKSIVVILEVLALVIVLYFNDCVKRRLEWLSVLSEPSL